MKIIVTCSILLFLNGMPLYAGEMPGITVAAASNFIRPMDKIVEYFEAAGDIKVDTVYSSTGKLYARSDQGKQGLFWRLPEAPEV